MPDLGKAQVKRGWAKVFVFDDRFKRFGDYKDAQRDARDADRGVWGQCGGDFHRPA